MGAPDRARPVITRIHDMDDTKTHRQVGLATILAAAYGLGYLVFERAGVGSDLLRDVVGNVAFLPLNLLAGGLALLASRQAVLDESVRRALRLLAWAALAVFLGNLVSLGRLLAYGETGGASVADLFYLADIGLMAAALLTFPLSRRIRLERWKLALDAAMVLAGGAVLVWYFTILPLADAGVRHGVADHLLAYTYPLADLLLLLAVTTVLLRGPLDGNRLAFHALVAGISVSILGDLTFDVVLARTGERSAMWPDIVYLLAYLLLVASAEQYWRHPVPRMWGPEEQEPRPQPLSPLPYLASAAVLSLLLLEAMEGRLEPMRGLAVGAVIVTSLGVLRQLIAVRQNVRLLAASAVRENEARFRSLVQHSSDVILIIDAEGTIRYVSPSAMRVLRHDAAALTGRALVDLVDPADRPRVAAFVPAAVAHGGVGMPEEWRFLRPDGAPVHAEVVATNLLADPTVRGIVLNTRDVGERKRLEHELLHQAFHDPLTGLANRALFRDRVSHALALATRSRRHIAVLFLDLDDFKKVNDSLGHSAGDRLLVAAAERFRSCGRTADTIARLGGDEFAILVEDGDGARDHEALAARLKAAMAQPFTLNGTEVFVSASIGIATSCGDTTADSPLEAADEVLRNADVAMYAAKRAGKGRVEHYARQMSADVRRRLELERALRRALEHDELLLHYQPIVSLRTGTLLGLEALVRWEHPEFGHLGPAHFIPLAEETGLITQVGGWVLGEACRQLAAWRAAGIGHDVWVSVNVSSRELLHDRSLATDVAGVLRGTGLDAGALVLEITESVLMQQTANNLDELRELRALGVRLALDDFGTGYSSLSYLKRFPIDVLKIAKPFIEDIDGGRDHSALASAIVGLSRTLHLSTIAEGVENPRQLRALRELGCEGGQGHLFAAAMPAPDAARYLAERPIIQLQSA
jgi:diguanylate cyclase (GGDEF)-like protein/PAS domain S-box-containing protein